MPAPETFGFDIDKSWEENLEAFKVYAAGKDVECAELLFKNLATLMVGDGITGRRDFNQTILAGCVITR